VTLEQLLTDTLHTADDFSPSPDLFAKVQRSIEEDRAHRRRVRVVLAWLAAAVVAIVVYVAATGNAVERDFYRGFEMPFGALALLTTVVMTAIVVVMGPAIRRFGETYEREVFAGSPETGTQVLRLLDIAYYLIFGAFILMTLFFDAPSDLQPWERQFPDHLYYEMIRLGGLLFTMAVLHVVLLLSLPVVGLIHSANLRRARIADGAVSTDALADRLDKAISVGAWLAALLILAPLVLAVLGGIIGLGAGG
jgi:hypothetical protein